MPPAGPARDQVAYALRRAYGEGLLSDATLAHRLELLLRSVVVDPQKLVGDLSVRSRQSRLAALTRLAATGVRRRLSPGAGPDGAAVPLLALDWSGAGAGDELLLGRHPACDLVLEDPSVSRRHARLSFRDGNWILRDLESTNGTTVNGTPVVRCRLLPGDRLSLGDQALVVD